VLRRSARTRGSAELLELMEPLFGIAGANPDELEVSSSKAAEVAEIEGDLDGLTSAFSRIEQGYLRESLFGSAARFSCALCGALLPRELLVAAHIKKRSVRSPSERRDAANIVMAACNVGCDVLFERGFISVDTTGRVVSAGKTGGSVLADRLDALNGRACSAFTAESGGYFLWHFECSFRG